ncbi:MAG: Crp/Fnr family transcriptional regulator [Candidatus Andeanibacterium colombiense]|uniref:Crp/Fnr family transcriptional regulator n=1 Tax=Candidatus Andeanibacterium colombiense TaxID=3121345 RepID=A0AAJ5X8G3_9SPHN|nr:MAG: Crp/Fnr family transcriptional regulator [Sphingomonadaceae bacterium]
MTNCDTCSVRNRAICSALDSDEIAALSMIGRRRTLTAGEALIWEGEDATLVANVIEGVLKLSTTMEDGREQIVGVAYPADFIGRPFGGTASHSVTALTDARVCLFPRGDFDGFARKHPELEHKLLRQTLAELDRTRNWMVLLGRKSADERLATFLLDMSARLGAGCETPAPLDEFELPFSRSQIADILGLTIETVSRQLTRLKREGVIDLPARRAVRILDRAELEYRAG